MFKLKLIQNRKKLVVVAISVIFIALIVVGSLIVYPFLFKRPEQTIIDEYNSDTSFFSGDRESKLKEGFDLYENYFDGYEFVLSSFDINNPKYSLVYKSPGTDTLSYIDLITLERDRFLNWKVVESQAITLKNTSFQEAIEIARKYDLSKENPDPENITVYEPPTKEEIESRKEASIEEKIITKISEEFVDPDTTNERRLELVEMEIERINRKENPDEEDLNILKDAEIIKQQILDGTFEL